MSSEKMIYELLKRKNGIYISVDSFGDDMLVKQMAVPKMVYSHENALFLHDLTYRTPGMYSATVPSCYKPSRRILDNLKVYYVSEKVYALGIIEKRNGMGNVVCVYDKDRTICDVLHRKKIRISRYRQPLNDGYRSNGSGFPIK